MIDNIVILSIEDRMSDREFGAKRGVALYCPTGACQGTVRRCQKNEGKARESGGCSGEEGSNKRQKRG